ncbi:MAG: DUF1376 domain-containing protein [Gammaproteobacteria bacterium]|nr:DUF1376 domain-containing protein [Gammaproteobacteria bacterium]
MNFYRRYMGDYNKGTSHLSLAEHGAYTVLLDHYYATGYPLPGPVESLHRICRAMSKPEQQAVASVADQFFPLQPDGLRHNRRADEELTIWHDRAEANRINGPKGGRPKKEPTNNPNGYKVDNPQETQSTSEVEPKDNPIPEARSQKLEVRTQNPDSGTSVGLEPDRAAVSACIERIFAHWKTVHGHPRAVLDDKRRKLIRDRLKTHDEATLCEAITGYLNSPHHMGQNDRNTVYDDIETILRSAKQIDAGLKFHAQPPRTDQSTLTRKNVAAVADWIPPEMRRAAS